MTPQQRQAAIERHQRKGKPPPFCGAYFCDRMATHELAIGRLRGGYTRTFLRCQQHVMALVAELSSKGTSYRISTVNGAEPEAPVTAPG